MIGIAGAAIGGGIVGGRITAGIVIGGGTVGGRLGGGTTAAGWVACETRPPGIGGGFAGADDEGVAGGREDPGGGRDSPVDTGGKGTRA